MRLRNNLSIIDNLPLYKVDALIAFYIFKINVAIVRFDYGYRFYNRVMYHSAVAQQLPRTKKSSYVIDFKHPADWYEFYRPTQKSKDAVDLAKKVNTNIYLTFNGNKVTSTIANRHQITGSFAEVLAKTCLLQQLEEKQINLSVEDLSFLNEQDSKKVFGADLAPKQNLKIAPRLLKNIPKR